MWNWPCQTRIWNYGNMVSAVPFPNRNVEVPMPNPYSFGNLVDGFPFPSMNVELAMSNPYPYGNLVLAGSIPGTNVEMAMPSMRQSGIIRSIPGVEC
jgi:hypothetical protein